jgi:hypothetical protein
MTEPDDIVPVSNSHPSLAELGVRFIYGLGGGLALVLIFLGMLILAPCVVVPKGVLATQELKILASSLVLGCGMFGLYFGDQFVRGLWQCISELLFNALSAIGWPC